jgi:hypothetical protein
MDDRSVWRCVFEYLICFLIRNRNLSKLNIIKQLIFWNSVVHINIHCREQFLDDFNRNFKRCISLTKVFRGTLIRISKLRHADCFVRHLCFQCFLFNHWKLISSFFFFKLSQNSFNDWVKLFDWLLSDEMGIRIYIYVSCFFSESCILNIRHAL